MIEFDLKRLDLLITSQEGRALFPNKDVADQKRGELETHWDNLGIPKNLKCVVDFLSGRDQFVCFDPNPSTSTTGGEDTSKSEDCVPDPSVELPENENSGSDSALSLGKMLGLGGGALVGVCIVAACIKMRIENKKARTRKATRSLGWLSGSRRVRNKLSTLRDPMTRMAQVAQAQSA